MSRSQATRHIGIFSTTFQWVRRALFEHRMRFCRRKVDDVFFLMTAPHECMAFPLNHAVSFARKVWRSLILDILPHLSFFPSGFQEHWRETGWVFFVKSLPSWTANSGSLRQAETFLDPWEIMGMWELTYPVGFPWRWWLPRWISSGQWTPCPVFSPRRSWSSGMGRKQPSP